MKDLEDKKSVLSFGGITGPNSVKDDAEYPFKIDEHDFVPHFQRVSISGDDTGQVNLNNLIILLFSSSTSTYL